MPMGADAIKHSDSFDSSNMLHSANIAMHRCFNCTKLELELAELRNRISPADDMVPNNLWDIFPPQGKYLKNILKFSGYETRDSVLKLREEGELEKVFTFVKGMVDLIDDREEMFGIFSKNPDKVMLLPGLKPVLAKFMEAVQDLKNAAAFSNVAIFQNVLKKKKLSDHRNKLKVHQRSAEMELKIEEALSRRICSWIQAQQNFTQKLNSQGILHMKDAFVISKYSSDNGSGFMFACSVCKIKISLPRKSDDTFLISNATRHISKVCWMSEKKQKTYQSVKAPLTTDCFRYQNQPVPSNKDVFIIKDEITDNNTIKDDSSSSLDIESSVNKTFGDHYGLCSMVDVSSNSSSSTYIRSLIPKNLQNTSAY